jgi:hypothetical protein
MAEYVMRTSTICGFQQLLLMANTKRSGLAVSVACMERKICIYYVKQQVSTLGLRWENTETQPERIRESGHGLA